MKWIDEEKDLRGKRVLMRIDCNTPIEDGVVADTFRITTILPTIMFLKEAGARTILLGHLGRDGASLSPIHDVLEEHTDVTFVHDLVGEDAQEAVRALKDGDAILLENVRRDSREEDNNDAFARELAALADIYVNEAFAVSHRKHTSLVGVPKYVPSFGGMRLRAEMETLNQTLAPEHPALFVIGGAKFETKFPLIEKFSEIYDEVFVCGALANNFFRARGFEIGTSLISGEDVDIDTLLSRSNITTPVDVIVGDYPGRTKDVAEVSPNERILDAGPKTQALLAEKVAQMHCVVWNGPLGEYEQGFDEGTKALARAIAESSAHSVVGGGDTAAAISELQLRDKFTFLSTGGGAMLEFLLHGTLPGIEVLS